LTAFHASSARIAIVIGDIPPLSEPVLGLEGPRGPFCMPFNTSSKPMVVSPANDFGPRAEKITAAYDGYKARRRYIDRQVARLLLSNGCREGAE
jgi:hypothetical protein